MNIILDPFELLPGVKLFIYNTNQDQVIGAVTFRNNKDSKVLPLSQMNAGKVYFELQVPISWKEFGQFEISTIGVEKKKASVFFKSPTDEYFRRSQGCNYNVNCITSPNVQVQKNAVVRIIYNGSQRCSGTLINNIEGDGTPFVITAGHCFNTQNIANTAVFYFNYESPDCSFIDGPIHSISGATLLAAGYHTDRSDTLDFTLVKLSEAPPLDYNPYYSGWDATGITPDSTYVMHHPMGDIKKISYDSDMPLTGNAGLSFDVNVHWFIQNYEKGTTEVGSSGAGLINQENRLVGTLTGGLAPCTENISDFYQKFSHAYIDYSDSTYQLKHWLDPKNTGLLQCNGKDPTGMILKKMADVISNYDTSEPLGSISQNKSWGYLAGHNYQGNNLFAEHFTIKGSKYLYQMEFFPAVVSYSTPDQAVHFCIWEGGDKPGNIIYEKKYYLAEFNSPLESFDVHFDSTIFVSNDFYAGYKIAYEHDTFAVKTTYSTTMSNTAYTQLDGVWKPLQLDGVAYPSHLAINVYTFDFLPKIDNLPDTSNHNHVFVYPNPFDDQIQVLFKSQPKGRVICKMYDLSGKAVVIKQFSEPSINQPLKVDLQRGVYFLQVIEDNNEPVTFKVFVR
jgi:lysyl endopeptidase